MYLGSRNLGIINPNTFGGGLSPRILFINNEAGLSLDVETAYLRGWAYQDSAGATVAAAPGDTVGLILDTSKGALDALGGELVSNGTFATDTVWSKGANWTIGGGVATKTGGAANNLTQTISSTAGLWYRITIDVTRTAGTLTVSLGTSGTTYAISLNGSYAFFILAGTSTQTLTLAGDSAFAGTVDNVTSKLVPGNHAYQTTPGSRPLLARTPDGGRRNLLLYSEQFDNATWTKVFSSVTANTETAPNGTTTADLLVEDSTTNGRYLQQSLVTTVQSYTFSCYFKRPLLNARRYVLLYHNESVKGWVFDIENGVVGAGGTTAVGAPAAYGITSVGNGWYRCFITITGTAATNNFRAYIVTNDGSGSASYTGNGSSGMLVWGAQVETGSSATAYQRVGLTSDVTESGKRDCWGLLFDGSDDSLQTASVDFSATDKMTVMAGVRKNTDALSGMLCELSALASSNNGAFNFLAPRANNEDSYAITTNGVSAANLRSYTGNAAPRTDVLSFSLTTNAANSSAAIAARQNGASVAGIEVLTAVSSGNFGNYALFIGSRNSASIRFNGLIYTLIVRGATTPTQTIENFERNLLALRCGVTF
jgi:hypothetical protein